MRYAGILPQTDLRTATVEAIMYLVEQMTQDQQKLSLAQARGILEYTPMKEKEMADKVNPTRAFIGRWSIIQVDGDEEPNLEDTRPMPAVRT